MAIDLNKLSASCPKANPRNEFYTRLNSQEAVCTFVKPSSVAEYTNSFSGLTQIGDESYWINFAHGEVDETTPLNKQVKLDVIIEELQVSAKATPEDLVKYKKAVGDIVYRISFI